MYLPNMCPASLAEAWCHSIPESVIAGGRPMSGAPSGASVSAEQKSSVCLSQEAGPLMQGGKVSVCCGAADLPETPVLLLLAWFLRIMDFEMLMEGIFRIG